MAETSETSPLLASVEPQVQPDLEAANDAVPEPQPLLSAREYYPRAINHLTTFVLSISLLNVLIIILTFILILVDDPLRYSYWIEDFLSILGFWSFAVFIWALITLKYETIIGFNIFFDLVIAYCIAIYAGSLASRPPTFRSHPVAIACTVLIYAIAALGLLIAFCHLILLGLRVIACFKSRFWHRRSGTGDLTGAPGSWTFPTGEITFAFTIKVLRQQPFPAAAPVERSSGIEGQVLEPSHP